MSRGLNKVMLIGNLGQDPEMRYTPSGRPVTTFSVATTRNWTNAEGEKRSETEWCNIVAWGSLAEICNQYLKKGQQVYIEGRLQTRRWEDEEGSKRSTTEIVAREMIMLSERKDRAEGDSEAAEPGEFYPSGNEGEDFPF
ncbi:MAG: single-stranded DNA-binding protein [Anaerolineales bacterium]